MAVTDPVGRVEVDLTADLSAPAKGRRNASRSRLIWLRLRSTPRFWVGAVVVGLMILWAIVGLWITQWSPTDQDLINSSTGPTSLHWFGTDDIGQDMYAHTVSGRRSPRSSAIAGPAALAAAFVGAVAGYLGGKTIDAISRMINLLLVVPAFIILVLALNSDPLGCVVLTAFIAVSWHGEGGGDPLPDQVAA